MSKIAIIGAGASGIVAALISSINNEVILLDGNDKCGKKILLTGNGKCNYWNSNINVDKYYTDNIENLKKILTKENIRKTYNFLESLGIYPKIKNDLFYPYSNSSMSIREIFEKEINKSKIVFKTNFKVQKITKKSDYFIIESLDGNKIKTDKVIFATGSKAYPKTGSDGLGYDMLSSLGHKINKVYPSLVPLISNDLSLKKIENIRCDARVTLIIDGKNIKDEVGEIQFTKNGISGICVFNISSPVSKALNNQKVEVSIDFLPSICDTYTWFSNRNKNLLGKTIEEQLESIFNYKLMFTILEKAGISKNSKWDNLKENEKRNLCETIKNFKIEITGTESFDRGQVCTGGVSLKEINPLNMESKIVPNLYIIGELLDVDGKCGGFNLAFAFITGYLAGSGIND